MTELFEELPRRLVYVILSARVSHYNASVQVLDDGNGKSL
jgi:hypothetical protein